MRRPRHRPRSSARLSISLLSALALLVFASVPALAQAECSDSSCKQYEVEIPTAGGNPGKKPGKSHASEPEAEASNKSSGKNKQQPSQGNSEEPEEGKGGGAPGNGNGGNGNGGGSGQGNSPGGNASNKTGLGEEQPVATASETGKPVSHSSGGSSPLVPILIAIAVLAAISIGAVVLRQRRQGNGGSGSAVSPKAG